MTGLQTFMLHGSFSHATLSDWGWHTAANPENYRPEETMIEVKGGGGRKVPYAANSKHHWPELPPEEAKRAEGAWNYFRQNPGRLPLGQIRFHLFKADGKLIEPTDLNKIRQTLDLWTGIVESSYEIEGVPVKVVTCCHPQQDLVAVQVKSKLMSEGRLKVFWEFPAVTANEVTEAETQGAGRVDLTRTLDADRYFVSVAWEQGEWASGSWNPGWPRRYLLTPSRDTDAFSFVCRFSPQAIGELPTFPQTAAASTKAWPEFWQSGGAIDLSESKDPRWRELERRIVLAQYLTKINSTGSSPPQESGLFSNSWHGKFHLEMTAWHGIHFTLWGREHLVDGWMEWLRGPGLEAARRQAARQGYKGAPLDEDDRADRPVGVAVGCRPVPYDSAGPCHLLGRTDVSRPPHARDAGSVPGTGHAVGPVHGRLSLVGRRDRPLRTGAAVVDRLGGHQLANDVQLDRRAFLLVLRPAYGAAWRERLGLPREAKWDEVLAKLSQPPVVDGLCVDAEGIRPPPAEAPIRSGMYPRPAWFESYGCMRGDEIDRAAVQRTFDLIWKQVGEGHRWMFWGCDFPMMAMTAARLGNPQAALHALLADHPNNVVLANGFNTAGSMPYLPGTGGLLWTAALMATGWDGGPDRHAPGFPNDGNWVVKWEGLRKSQ